MATALEICLANVKSPRVTASVVDGCLGCEGVTFRPVTLRDGRVVCTECDDYKTEIAEKPEGR